MTKKRFDELFVKHFKIIESYAINETRKYKKKQFEPQDILSESYIHFLKNMYLITEDNYVSFFAQWIKNNVKWDKPELSLLSKEKLMDENFTIPEKDDDEFENKLKEEAEIEVKKQELERFRITLKPSLQRIWDIIMNEETVRISTKKNGKGWTFNSTDLSKRIECSRTASFYYIEEIVNKLNNYLKINKI